MYCTGGSSISSPAVEEEDCLLAPSLFLQIDLLFSLLLPLSLVHDGNIKEPANNVLDIRFYVWAKKRKDTLDGKDSQIVYSALSTYLANMKKSRILEVDFKTSKSSVIVL